MELLENLSIEKIEALAELVKTYELDEITLSAKDETRTIDESLTIKGKRQNAPKGAPPMPYMPPMPPMMGQQTPANAAPQTAPEPQEKGFVVKSPIVGTFYAAPAPDEDAFVQVGDRVHKGDVLMIIESMKLMNEVPSEIDGVVTKIFVKDGDTVEYDQPLMVIE